jgi:hypothetical protein
MATLEETLWRMYLAEDAANHPQTPGENRTIRLRQPFAASLGESQRSTSERKMLFMLGVVAEPLWKRLHDKQMLLTTASRVAREAKIVGMERGISLRDAIDEALKEYDALPFCIFLKGIPVRRGHFSKTPKEPKTKTTRYTVPTGSAAKSEDYLVWQKLQQDMIAFVEKKIGKDAGLTASTIVKDFTVGMKVLIHEAQNKIKRAVELQQETAKARRVPRHAVVSACNTLKMDHPSVNQQVNLELAKRQKKILARLYHPDAHGGSDRTRLLYEEALAAYDLLEMYNLQLEPNGEPNHNA